MYGFVQQASASTSGGSTSTLACVFPNPISAGNTVLVAVAFGTETNTASVADGASNALTADSPFSNASDHWVVQFFRKGYVSAPGTATLTLTLAAGVASKGIWAVEYSGINPSAVLQSSWMRQAAPGTTAGALTSGAITPSAQPYLLATLSMSLTGSASAVPTVDGSYNNRFTSWRFAGQTGNCARWADKEGHDFTPNHAVLTAGVGTDTYYTGAIFIAETVLPNSYKTNPLGFSYSSTSGLAAWSHPSGMIVSGRTNRNDLAFAAARVAGAEHLAYFDIVERPDTALGGIDDAFYMGNPANVPLWPYPPGAPGTRVNFAGTHLTDITVGSTWANFAVNYIKGVMQSGVVDGMFLDVLGAQLFSTLSGWTSWPQNEKDAWTLGCIDLVRRLDALRRQINPNLILVNNNTWDRGDMVGFAGEPYVDGICLEHPTQSLYHFNYVARQTFSGLGHRRMLVIAQTGAAAIWAAAQGVTNVSDQQTYLTIDSPPIGFNALSDRNLPIPGGASASALGFATGGQIIFNPIKQGETSTFAFDFTSSLAVGETLSSPIITPAVYSGADPAPNGILSGNPTTSAARVYQNFTGVTAGVIYEVTCQVTTSLGQVLKQNALLAVEAVVP